MKVQFCHFSMCDGLSMSSHRCIPSHIYAIPTRLPTFEWSHLDTFPDDWNSYTIIWVWGLLNPLKHVACIHMWFKANYKWSLLCLSLVNNIVHLCFIKSWNNNKSIKCGLSKANIQLIPGTRNIFSDCWMHTCTLEWKQIFQIWLLHVICKVKKQLKYILRKIFFSVVFPGPNAEHEGISAVFLKKSNNKPKE